MIFIAKTTVRDFDGRFAMVKKLKQFYITYTSLLILGWKLRLINDKMKMLDNMSFLIQYWEMVFNASNRRKR